VSCKNTLFLLILTLLYGSVLHNVESCSVKRENTTCPVQKTVSSIKEQSEQAIQKTLEDLYQKEFGKTRLFEEKKEKSFLQGTNLYIFVSLSMPKQGLIDLGKQAQRFGGVLVLRGLLEGSYKKTAFYLREFIEKTDIGVIVDPLLFKHYTIQTVPSVVLMSTSGKTFDKIGGFISVKTALERMEREGELKEEARKLLSEGKLP